jgi:hypothetical protein
MTTSNSWLLSLKNKTKQNKKTHTRILEDQVFLAVEVV